MSAKISYLFYKLVNGGAELGGLKYSKLLKAAGYDIQLFTLRKTDDPILKLEITQILVKSFKEFRSADIIVSSISYASLCGEIFRKRKQKHYVWLHNTKFSNRHLIIYYLLDRIFKPTFIADSKFTQNYWRKYFHSKIECVPLFVADPNTEIENGAPQIIPEIVTVLRPVRQKGIERILLSALLLPNFSFYIYGADHDEISKFGNVPSNIKCIKFAPANEIYREHAIFVLLSRWEGLSIATLEALQANMLCLCTAVGAIPEHLDFQRRFLIENQSDQDVVDEFVKKLTSLFDKPHGVHENFAQIREKTLAFYNSDEILMRSDKLYNDRSNF